MRIAINAIDYYLPQKTVTNQDLGAENPSWDMKALEARTGVAERHIAAEGETALDLAARACEKLRASHGELTGKIDGILFCTESADHIIPPNACILHKVLGLPDEVFAFDFNLACSGYIYGLALAQGLICAGFASTVLLVTADTYSKYIHKQDRATRVLFGDAAAVSLLGRSVSSAGIVDIVCATSGTYYDKFIVPAGGCRMPRADSTSIPAVDNSGNSRTPENICMEGMGILAFVNRKVPAQVMGILKKNNLSIDDVDLFVFHQASNMVLDSLQRILKIKPDKMVRNLREVGNIVSASIPIALKEAILQGRVSSGDKVLLCGFGAGLSWGTALIEI
jgi:3-oxoacyl-[acyl-carrier-protein] synthase-3